MKSTAPLCALVAGTLLLSLATTGLAGERKTLTVRAGASATQVNNHPIAYTTPGYSTANCASNGNAYGTVNSTGPNSATVNATANSTTNCSGSYTPPSTVVGNSVTVNNSDWVTDVNTGDLYLLECTANWRGSKCSSLIEGDIFSAEIRGYDMFITGSKGLKPVTIKYKVLQFRQGAGLVKTSTSSPQKADQAKAQPETPQLVRQRADEARRKYADFDQVALNPNLPILKGSVVERWIMESELGMDVAYYLGQHTDELGKLNAMTPVDATRELTRLEDRLRQPAQ
jgi:hypothetical protein